jgi:hypothetical protein
MAAPSIVQALRSATKRAFRREQVTIAGKAMAGMQQAATR